MGTLIVLQISTRPIMRIKNYERIIMSFVENAKELAVCSITVPYFIGQVLVGSAKTVAKDIDWKISSWVLG